MFHEGGPGDGSLVTFSTPYVASAAAELTYNCQRRDTIIL